MRRLFFSLLVVMPLMAMAQMKLAVVDVQAIFNAMPAAQASQQVLSERSHYFEQEYKYALNPLPVSEQPGSHDDRGKLRPNVTACQSPADRYVFLTDHKYISC